MDAANLKSKCLGCKLTIKWLGTSRTLSDDQTSKAAAVFDADSKMLGARKRIFNTKHAVWRQMVKLCGETRRAWKSYTLPYTEPGIRLIKKQLVGDFDSVMKEAKAHLEDRILTLQHCYPQMLEDAKAGLGELFVEADYPHVDELPPLFDFCWEYTELTPPEHLKYLYPDIFKTQQSIAQAKLEESIALAQQAFATELSHMLKHLAERLTDEPGKKKVFRDSAVTNLLSFFAKFKQLSLGSNEELDVIVEKAKELLVGVSPDELRTDEQLKEQISTSMKDITSQLDELIVEAPRRKIILPKLEESAA